MFLRYIDAPTIDAFAVVLSGAALKLNAQYYEIKKVMLCQNIDESISIGMSQNITQKLSTLDASMVVYITISDILRKLSRN